MKITSFYPIIVSSGTDEIVRLFEDLGFEKRHHNQEVADRPSYQMKDAGGFRVDAVQNDGLSHDQVIIRMNVDNFEEAHAVLQAHGFKDGPRILDVRSSKAMGMVSPTGFIIGLVEHKKVHD